MPPPKDKVQNWPNQIDKNDDENPHDKWTVRPLMANDINERNNHQNELKYNHRHNEIPRKIREL